MAEGFRPTLHEKAIAVLHRKEIDAVGNRLDVVKVLLIDVSEDDIRLASVAAMAGAGARMLPDGTAARPSDIDMVAVHGLGFARRTGGVMFAADLIGLERVRDILQRLSVREPRIAPPAPIFDDLIRAKKTFADLDA